MQEEIIVGGVWNRWMCGLVMFRHRVRGMPKYRWHYAPPGIGAWSGYGQSMIDCQRQAQAKMHEVYLAQQKKSPPPTGVS